MRNQPEQEDEVFEVQATNDDIDQLNEEKNSYHRFAHSSFS